MQFKILNTIALKTMEDHFINSAASVKHNQYHLSTPLHAQITILMQNLSSIHRVHNTNGDKIRKHNGKHCSALVVSNYSPMKLWK